MADGQFSPPSVVRVPKQPADRLFMPELLLVGPELHEDWAVLARGGLIARVGPSEQLTRANPEATIEQLPRCLLMPGTVNGHSHSFQSLLRGVADDLAFTEWRAQLYQRAPEFDAEAVYTAALMAFGQMLLAGVTTVCDFFYLHHGGIEFDLAVISAAAELGIRLVLVRSMLDWAEAPAAFRETTPQAVANTRQLAAAVQGWGRTTVLPGPHSPHAASIEMIRAGAALAKEWDVPWHMHVAEARYEVDALRAITGRSPVAWLAKEGLLDSRLQVVHGVWVEPAEIEMLAGAKSGLVHCPGANLFLGDGLAPLAAYLAAGVSCALGCDSGSANSQLAVIHEARLAALLAKGTGGSSTAVTSAHALQMATAAGAAATGLPIGVLETGSAADMIAIDLDDLSMQPAANPLNNVVYSMELSAIRHVFVAGEPTVRNRQLVRRSEKSIVEQYRRLQEATPGPPMSAAVASR